MVVGGHPDEKGLKYLIQSQRENHFRFQDPMTAWARRSTARQAVGRREDLLASRLWREHPYFNEHVRPAGIGDLLIGFYRTDQKRGTAFGISVARSLNDSHFSVRDREVVRLFVEELHTMYVRRIFDPPPSAQQVDLSLLSPRQREVLKHLMAGMTIKQVAARLELGYRTVDDHVKQIYRRLKIHSRAELISRCSSIASPARCELISAASMLDSEFPPT